MATKKLTKASQPTPEETPSQLGENTKLTLTVTWDKIQAVYQTTLQKLAQNVTLTGFRTGKAPLPMVETHLGKDTITQESMKTLLPPFYEEALKQAGIMPLTQPDIHIQDSQEGKDWVFIAEIAVEPKVELKEYKDVAKKALKEFAIAQASKTTESKPSEEAIYDEKLRALFTALIQAVAPKVAPLLLRDEMSRQLQSLLEELKTHGLTLKDYLEKHTQTTVQFNQELAISALAALQLEFTLRAISQDMKIYVDDAEIKKALHIDENKPLPAIEPQLLEQFKSNLIRKKTVDALLALEEK